LSENKEKAASSKIKVALVPKRKIVALLHMEND
jgi:hypothetical protein